MAQKPYSLSAVMPAYNEGAVIELVIENICCQVLAKFKDREFIIVNDCSTDNTLAILEKMKEKYGFIKIINNERNLGHGPSVMKGYAVAQGDFVFSLDSDNQIPIEQFWLLWEKMEKENLDIVNGIRKKRKDPYFRLLISKILQVFNRIIFGVKIRDINCPFKLYKKEVLKQILNILPENTHIPSILTLLATKPLQIKVGEVAVAHLPRVTGKSFLRHWKILKLGWQSLIELIRFKINL